MQTPATTRTTCIGYSLFWLWLLVVALGCLISVGLAESVAGVVTGWRCLESCRQLNDCY
jgi:hypothetical protein